MGLFQCVRASKIWIKAQFAKLRRRKPDRRAEDAPRQSMSMAAARGKRSGSEFFRRTRTRTVSRSKRRSKSHPEASASRSYFDEREEELLATCLQCQTQFQCRTSRYLDYCSDACKSAAVLRKSEQGEATTRLSEWI